MRQEDRINSFSVFADLVKVHNSMCYTIIITTLWKDEYFSRVCGIGLKLCSNFSVVLKLAKEEINTRYRCSLRQGDNPALVPFIIVLQLVT